MVLFKIKQRLYALQTKREDIKLTSTRGSIATLSTKPSPVVVEVNRDRNQRSGNTAQQCTSPLDSHIIKHVRCEEWEACRNDGTQKCVC
jgi:hypothetical protein